MGPTRRERVVDVLAVAVSLVAMVWVLRDAEEILVRLPDWWLPLDVGLGLVSCALLMWRRTHPVAVCLVLIPMGALFLAVGIPALISLYTVATRSRFWVALVLTVLHLGGAIGYYFLVGTFADTGLAVWAVLMGLLYVSALSIGLAVRSRRQVIVGLKMSAERDRREFAVRVDRAREAERARIAREMHDVLAHRISLLAMHAGALEYRSRPGASPVTPTELADAAGVIRQSAYWALEELRDVLTVLQPDRTDRDGMAHELGTAPPPPTVAGLPALVAEAAAAGQRVELDVLLTAEQQRSLRPQSQRTVYRVVQEGLTNARKHAPGAQVEVRVAGDDGGRIAVTVRNGLPVGTTGAEIPGAGTGLAGLAERVGVDDGQLRSSVGDGRFELIAEIPFASAG